VEASWPRCQCTAGTSCRSRWPAWEAIPSTTPRVEVDTSVAPTGVSRQPETTVVLAAVVHQRCRLAVLCKSLLVAAGVRAATRASVWSATAITPMRAVPAEGAAVRVARTDQVATCHLVNPVAEGAGAAHRQEPAEQLNVAQVRLAVLRGLVALAVKIAIRRPAGEAEEVPAIKAVAAVGEEDARRSATVPAVGAAEARATQSLLRQTF
jgi:hypothetical protein